MNDDYDYSRFGDEPERSDLSPIAPPVELGAAQPSTFSGAATFPAARPPFDWNAEYSDAASVMVDEENDKAKSEEGQSGAGLGPGPAASTAGPSSSESRFTSQ